MKIALLCPGPSLPDWWNDSMMRDYGRVIAVNRAAHLFKCHWFAFSDWEVIRGTNRKPKIGYVCKDGMQPEDESRRWRNIYTAMRARDVAPEYDPKAQDCSYTMPNALAWALVWSGSKGDVHIYGMDCSADLDVAGGEGDHSAKRWVEERQWLGLIWCDRIRVYGDADFAYPWKSD